MSEIDDALEAYGAGEIDEDELEDLCPGIFGFYPYDDDED